LLRRFAPRNGDKTPRAALNACLRGTGARRSAQHFFLGEAAFSPQLALFASSALFALLIVVWAAFLALMRRAAAPIN
jgi:hypothetical protein